MKQLVLLVLAMALVGCEFCQSHRVVCTTAAGVALVSLELSHKGKRQGKRVDTEPQMSVPREPNCQLYPETCK